VQAGSVEVALELVPREREVGVRVRAVHDDLDPARPRRTHDVPDREDLARQVRDVADVDDTGARADRPFDAVRQVLYARRRDREGDLLHDDALPPRAL